MSAAIAMNVLSVGAVVEIAAAGLIRAARVRTTRRRRSRVAVR